MAIDQFGLLPPDIRQSLEQDAIIDRHLAKRDALDHALKQIDRNLSVILAKENAAPVGGLIPGYWHVRRENTPPLRPSYMPITDEDGGFCEPHFGVLAELDRRDLQKHGLPDLEPKRAKDYDKEARVDEIAANLRAASRVPGDGGMTRRKWGRG